ncbi:MAG: flagellar biosynthetic protein FliO [Bacillota bacterium]|nr:flagellar biosynthetic protein FliO [Bacillota bacterium]
MAAAVDPVVTGIRLIAGLAIVIVLIYLTGLALRALQWRRIGARGRPAMELRESLSLGPGRAVHLVRVADRLLVLGATSTHISMLAEVDAGSLEDTGRQEDRVQTAPEKGRRFDEILDAYMRRFGDDRHRGEDTDDHNTHL